MLTAMMFTACVNDDGKCLDESVRKVNFTIAMDDAVARSRATWGEPYTGEEGTAFENLIKPESLKIAILDVNNNHLGVVENVAYWQESTNTYRVLGEISHINLTAGTDYKVLVLANSGTDALHEGITYSIDALSSAIPMFGVLQTAFTLDSNQNLGEIYMLRSAAKVEMVLSSALVAEGYSLGSAGLKNYRDAGYVYPLGWTSVGDTKEIDQENCRIDAGHIITAAKALSVNEQGSSATLYLPEYGNAVHKDTNPTSISVVLNKAGESLLYEDAIRFCEYDASGTAVDGSEYNIVRNHIYRFVITGVSSGGLEIVYMVADWDDADKYSYDLAYPTYHNPVVPDDYNRVIHDENYSNFPIPSMRYDAVNPEAGAFSCWLKIMAPEGQIWSPVIRESQSHYTIKVYREETDGTMTSVSGNDLVADSERWYNIKVYPEEPTDVESTVKFGITYDMSWYLGGGSQFLFINGAEENIAWPQSGSDPKIIEIKHKVN